jgi:acyl carrier protein
LAAPCDDLRGPANGHVARSLLLRDRALHREFAFEENLRDVGLSSLDMTSLVFAVEADFAIEIPDRAITPANFTSVASIGRLVRTLVPADARAAG